MKFGEHLRSHLTPEWYSQYLAYEEMKDMFMKTVNKIPQTSKTDLNFSRDDYFLLADDEFFAVRTSSRSDFYLSVHLIFVLAL